MNLLLKSLKLQRYFARDNNYQNLARHITYWKSTSSEVKRTQCNNRCKRNKKLYCSLRSFHHSSTKKSSGQKYSSATDEIDPFEDFETRELPSRPGRSFRNVNERPEDFYDEPSGRSRSYKSFGSRNDKFNQFDGEEFPQQSRINRSFRDNNYDSIDDFPRRHRPQRFSERRQYGNSFRRSFKERDPEEYIPKTEFVEEELFDEGNTGINFDKYDAIPVEVSGNECPDHINSFDELNVVDTLKKNMARSKYGKPTPVQKYAFPIALAQRDLMSCAQTGSGKTAAFLIPLLNHIMNDSRKEQQVDKFLSPSGLIIAPTRELASQLYKEAVRFAYRTGVKSCIVYGGASIGVQMKNIERGCDLLVATPGRLNDLLERGAVYLKRCKYVVLDEADRMLDMGFEPQIRRIVQDHDMPQSEDRQTLMFSATFPEEIQELAKDFLNDYVFLAVGRVGSTSENITQNVLYMDQREKISRLLNLLAEEDPKARKLIFVSMKRTAEFIESHLRSHQIMASSIHGDRSQRKREDALFKFKTGITPTLVATSVAARGLDIPNVAHVINYDLPYDIDEYVHRIGRTGRVGNTGNATSFFTDTDSNLANDLSSLLKETNQEVPMWLEKLSSRRYKGKGHSRNRTNSQFGGRDFRKRSQNTSRYGERKSWNKFGNLDHKESMYSSFPGGDRFNRKHLYGIEEEDEVEFVKT